MSILNDFSSAYENLRDDARDAYLDLRGLSRRNDMAPAISSLRNSIVEDLGRPGGYRFVALIARLMSGIANAYQSQHTMQINNIHFILRNNIFTGEFRAVARPLPTFGLAFLNIHLPVVQPVEPEPIIGAEEIPPGEEEYTYITQERNRRLLERAAAAAGQHSDSLPAGAGARDFFERGVRGYVETLQQPMQLSAQEIQRLSELPATPEVSAALEEARNAHNATIAEFQEKIEDLETCMPESYVGLLNYVVLQAVRSERPLMENDLPTQELPLALHGIGNDLEALRQKHVRGEFTDLDRQRIEGLAYNLQQGNLAFRVGVTTALSNHLYRERS